MFHIRLQPLQLSSEIRLSAQQALLQRRFQPWYIAGARVVPSLLLIRAFAAPVFSLPSERQLMRFDSFLRSSPRMRRSRGAAHFQHSASQPPAQLRQLPPYALLAQPRCFQPPHVQPCSSSRQMPQLPPPLHCRLEFMKSSLLRLQLMFLHEVCRDIFLIFLLHATHFHIQASTATWLSHHMIF